MDGTVDQIFEQLKQVGEQIQAGLWKPDDLVELRSIAQDIFDLNASAERADKGGWVDAGPVGAPATDASGQPVVPDVTVRFTNNTESDALVDPKAAVRGANGTVMTLVTLKDGDGNDLAAGAPVPKGAAKELRVPLPGIDFAHDSFDPSDVGQLHVGWTSTPTPDQLHALCASIFLDPSASAPGGDQLSVEVVPGCFTGDGPKALKKLVLHLLPAGPDLELSADTSSGTIPLPRDAIGDLLGQDTALSFSYQVNNVYADGSSTPGPETPYGGQNPLTIAPVAG
jgi:hypothetical protein